MNKEKYIKDVLKSIYIDKKTKNRIREDLLERISIAEDRDPYFDVTKEIGLPNEVAAEFMENLDIKTERVVQIGLSYNMKLYEYKSKLKFFGVPLVHINTGGRYDNKVAKGIIAIGDISFGVISVGGISIGGISIGGLSVGLLAIGGIAAGFGAIGGIAIGAYALGGIAVGFAKVFGGLQFIIK